MRQPTISNDHPPIKKRTSRFAFFYIPTHEAEIASLAMLMRGGAMAPARS
jgi:transposase-like protein